MSSVPCILALSRRFIGHGACKKKSRPPHKHHFRLDLLHVLSSTARLCKVIRFPYSFRCGKVETQYCWWDWNCKGWRLVIRMGALLVNTIFCDEWIRWEVGTNKVISGCGLSGMLLDDDKWDHVMRLHGHNITTSLHLKLYGNWIIL